MITPEAVQAIGEEYHYKTATLEFQPFEELKVKWVRSSYWIQLIIGDYLEDAPEAVQACLIRHVLGKIRGDDVGDYPQAVKDYLLALKDDADKKKTYLDRHKAVAPVITTGDDTVTLAYTLDKNLDGHVSALFNVAFTTTKRPCPRRTATIDKAIKARKDFIEGVTA